MVELFHNYSLVEPGKYAVLIPIILTTANIWTSSIDLGAADINSGELKLPQIQLDSKQWVYYEYHQAPGLKNSFSNHTSGRKEIESILDREYIRTIPIVTASAISDFLKGDILWKPSTILQKGWTCSFRSPHLPAYSRQSSPGCRRNSGRCQPILGPQQSRGNYSLSSQVRG